MKKVISSVLILVMVLAFAGCGKEADYYEQPPAIMVEGIIYRYTDEPLAGDVDESAIIGYTTSYTDFFPTKDGETNFNHELNMPYAKVDGGIAVLYGNEWYLCVEMPN